MFVRIGLPKISEKMSRRRDEKFKKRDPIRHPTADSASGGRALSSLPESLREVPDRFDRGHLFPVSFPLRRRRKRRDMGGAKVPVLVPLKPSRVAVVLLPSLRGRWEFPAGTRRSEEAFLPARSVSAAALSHTGRTRQEDDGSVGRGEGQPVVVKVAVVAAVFVWRAHAAAAVPISALLGPAHLVIVRHAWVRCHGGTKGSGCHPSSGILSPVAR